MSDYKDRRSAIIIFGLITFSTLGYYLLNNVYDSWAYNPNTNVLLVILAYYTISQPLYLAFLWLIAERFSTRGLVAGILLMVALDVSSVPHSIASVMPGQTTTIPLDPSLAPYADYALARALSNQGIISFWPLIFIYIILPTILDLIALFLVSPETYEALVESA